MDRIVEKLFSFQYKRIKSLFIFASIYLEMDKNIYIERLILLFIHFSTKYLVALNEKKDVVLQLKYLLKKLNFKIETFF